MHVHTCGRMCAGHKGFRGIQNTCTNTLNPHCVHVLFQQYPTVPAKFFLVLNCNYSANGVLACVLHIHVPFGKINLHVYHHSVYTGLLM